MSTFLLSLIIFSPLLGVLLICFVPKNREVLIKAVGVGSTIFTCLLMVLLYIQSSGGHNYDSFSQKATWFRFGDPELYGKYFSVSYEVGINGFSFLMIALTAFLCLLASVASFKIKTNWKGYFLLFLTLQIGMMGVFAAENLVLFFIFFEVTLIPMFFLIGRWGLFEKEKASYYFLIYNGIGSAILLVVFVLLFAKTGTANIEQLQGILQSTDAFSNKAKLTLLIALLIAFGIKLPIFPLHTWVLKVHTQAPVPIVMVHAGVLLKIGAFGLIRFGIGFFPDQFAHLSFLIALLGVINLLFGAFLALKQDDLRLVLAYSSLSHMGIILMGLGAGNESGMQGAVFQVVSHGLIAAFLFFLIGVLYERTGTTTLSKLGGLAKNMPIASGFLLAGGLASLGLPGMSGFISEFMAFMGLFQHSPYLAGIATLGMILTAVYVLKAVLSITFGNEVKLVGGKDLNRLEWAPALLFIFLIIGIGVYPSLLTNMIQPVLDTMVWG